MTPAKKQALRFGVSGSTILSDPDRLDELFWEGIDHIEVGSLSSGTDLDKLLDRARQQALSVGFHSPLLKGGSKYDLLLQVEQQPEAAWRQLAEELKIAKANQVEYVLVHFPFFLSAAAPDPIPQIDAGLERLAELQAKYGTTILCEPKLGVRQDPGGIGILRDYPVERWLDFAVPMCWDMGDWILAAGSPSTYLDDFGRWAGAIAAIHVHDVKVEEKRYYWLAVHPSYEGKEPFLSLKPFFAALKSMGVLLVWEHTPHFLPDQGFALEGFRWAKHELGAA